MRPKLLDVLVCTWCLGPLELGEDELRCRRCRARYRIEDGIPNMLLGDAALLCPACGSDLRHDGNEAVCEPCGRSFDISRRLDPADFPAPGAPDAGGPSGRTG